MAAVVALFHLICPSRMWGSVFKIYGLVVAVELERRRSLFLRSEAGLLGSAERELILHSGTREIDRQQSRFHPIHKVEDSRDVGSLNRSGESERDVVCDAHGIFEILGTHYCEHRTEDLFPRNSHLLGDIGKNRRRAVVPLVVSASCQALAAHSR